MTVIDKNLTHNTKELAIWHWMRKEPTLCFHPLEDKVLILVTSAIRQNISVKNIKEYTFFSNPTNLFNLGRNGCDDQLVNKKRLPQF